MAWKATGQPTVRKQRDKWVVRVDGIDTATGKVRPRQLGSYASPRAAGTKPSTNAVSTATGTIIRNRCMSVSSDVIRQRLRGRTYGPGRSTAGSPRRVPSTS